MVSWTYDDSYQLTREERTGTSSFDVTHVYDPVGNQTQLIKSGAITTYTYDVANAATKSIRGRPNARD